MTTLSKSSFCSKRALILTRGETALGKYDDDVKQLLIKHGAVPIAKAAEEE